MEETPEGWRMISRHGNYGGLLRTLSSFVTLVPPKPETITIKLREISTGIVYSITANDERSVTAKLRDREFD
jgi:hypothetical protein